jgi:hypothetical protein
MVEPLTAGVLGFVVGGVVGLVAGLLVGVLLGGIDLFGWLDVFDVVELLG